MPWTETPTWGVTRNPWDLERSARRLERRQRGGGGRGPGGRGARLRRRRVDPHPGGLLRAVRAEDAARPGAAGAARGRLARPVGERRADALGRRHARCSTTRSPTGRRTPARRPCRRAPSLEARSAAAERLAARDAADRVSTRKLPPSPLTRLHPDEPARAAGDGRAAARARPRGRRARARPRAAAPAPEFTVRFLRGLHDERARSPIPSAWNGACARWRASAAALPAACSSWALRRRAAYARAAERPLLDHDVLLTPVTPAPPPRIGALRGPRLAVHDADRGVATVPYAACWNVTGQPAGSVPAGFGSDGLPRAVQLVGRPNDEATLLVAGRADRGRAPVGADARPPGFS